MRRPQPVVLAVIVSTFFVGLGGVYSQTGSVNPRTAAVTDD